MGSLRLACITTIGLQLAAGGFTQTPMTEEIETQEVREQLYICEVLHCVGSKPQHAAPYKWCQEKSKDWGILSKHLFNDKQIILAFKYFRVVKVYH